VADEPATLTLSTLEITEPRMGPGDPADDIEGFELGSPATSGALRAKRTGRPGRVYTLGYTGLDFADNSATCSTTVVVPLHPDRKSRRDPSPNDRRSAQ